MASEVFEGSGGSDRLGNELAEDHLHDRGDRQRDRNRHPGRHLTERSLDARLEDAGYRGSASTPRSSDVIVMPSCAPDKWYESATTSAAPPQPRLALAGPLVDPSAVDRDEGEFRRHEPGVGDDERERGEEPYGGVDQDP